MEGYSQTRGGVKESWTLSEICHLFKNSKFKYDKSLRIVNSGFGILCFLVCVLVAQSCPALCDPMDCSLSGCSVRGIFQTILEWVASFRVFPPPGDLSNPGIELTSFLRLLRWQALGKPRTLSFSKRISKRSCEEDCVLLFRINHKASNC